MPYLNRAESVAVDCNCVVIEKYAKAVNAGKIPLEKAAFLSSEEIARRRLIMGLFTEINRAEFKKLYGFDPVNDGPFAPQVNEFCSASAMQVTEDNVSLTKLGLLFMESIQEEFYSDEVKAFGRMKK